MEREKPPDMYMTIKDVYNKHLKNKAENVKITDDAVTRTQKIIGHTYMFLKIFVISKNQMFEDKLLKINDDVVLMAMKLFIKEPKRGRTPLGSNKRIFDYFKSIYDEHYKNLWNEDKIDGTNLSGILHYAQTEIVTSIENNAKHHFIEYVNRYVNCCFKKRHEEILEKLNTKEKNIKRNELNLELKKVKDDIIHLTYTRNEKYNEWVNKNISKMVPFLPENYKKTHINNINDNPQSYIQNMRMMSESIIKMGYKTFNFFPLQNSNKPRYIHIDTKTIIDLFLKGKLEGNKNKYFGNISKYAHELWNKIFKSGSHDFDYMISTDGYSMSVRFIHRSFVPEKNRKKQALKKGQEKAREEYENLEREEIEVLKNKREEKNKKFKKTKK
jgi:hypothetical protein